MINLKIPTLKAAYLTTDGIKVVDVPIPEPKSGEIVVKVKVALTDGTDLKAFLRGHHIIGKGPFGHEYSGVVYKVGEGVKEFKLGDEVFGVNTAPCFTCGMCIKNRYNLCLNLKNNMVIGAYAEYLRIPKKVVDINLFHKPHKLPHRVAPMIEPLSCVFQALDKMLKYDFQDVLILGSGSIASMFASVLTLIGKKVSVVGRNSWKLEKIRKNLGIDTFKIDEVKGRFDAVIETTGNKRIWESSFNSVNRGGIVMLFGGLAKGESVKFDAHKFHYEDITILTSFHHTPNSVRKAYNFLLRNWKTLEFLISGEYELFDIETVFNQLSKGKGFKYAIIP